MMQYHAIKEKHRDAIVLFRLGDFYEMFGEDANVASRVLQIALTTRDKNRENPVPMCGIPYFASENYISKLIKAGHKVAVCEQMEEPKETKGIVKREVVRVITPGTHAPEYPKQNSFILSLVPRGKEHGIALADVSTGEFLIYETGRPLEDELARYEPREVLLPESLGKDIHYDEVLKNRYVSKVDDWKFDYSDAYKTLLRHFQVNSLGGYGCEDMPAAVSAAGALVAYVEDTQKEGLRFRKISTPDQGEYMFLDAPTQKNLELVRNLKDDSTEGSLLWALDETLTPMGGRFMRNSILRPLVSFDGIKKRQGAVKCLVEDYELIEKMRLGLRNVQDLERLAQRISTGNANARDLVAVKNSVAALPDMKSGLCGSLDGHLNELGNAVADFSALASTIEEAIEEHPPQSLKDSGIIKAGYHGEIDEIRDLSANTRDYLSSLEAEEKKATGIPSLKIGFNRIHGYYIEVTKANLAQAPERYVRRQTLVGGERFITPELKEYETKILGAEERLKALEYEVFLKVLDKVGESAEGLIETSEILAQADFLVSLAVVAKRHNYVMPKMADDMAIDIVNGRHPVIERLPLSERFIPNDTDMDGSGNRLLIITGPNMAGKSTYMRQVALIVLMAQIGGFVPAEEAAVGVVDRIFTRIGASDYLTRGQSTFMVEMVEAANILNNSTERSLILLDEVGRGTSTFDGISIAWATAEYIARNIRARTLFATHYNELTDLARTIDGIRNYNIAVKEWGDEIIFLRKVEAGPADKSYGIQVGRLAGLPEEVIKKAKEVLKSLEKQHVGDVSRHYRQMDLFSGLRDDVLEEVMALDLDGQEPEQLVKRLREILKKPSRQ